MNVVTTVANFLIDFRIIPTTPRMHSRDRIIPTASRMPAAARRVWSLFEATKTVMYEYMSLEAWNQIPQAKHARPSN